MNIKHGLEQRVYRFLMENPPESSVLAGVSGGADSMSLLHFLIKYRKVFGYKIHVANINHCLRGEEGDGDSRFVEEYCLQNDVVFHGLVADVDGIAKERGISTEEAGRDVRYKFFSSVCEEIGSATVMTAHNMNDDAETFFLNLFRGAGIKGLKGIDDRAGRAKRPLLTTTRAEIEAYCEEEEIPYCMDSTNETNDYTRNRIRHNILPAIEAEFPDFLRMLNRGMGNLRETDSFLDCMASSFLDENSGKNLELKKILEVHTALRHRIIQRFGEKSGLKFDYKKVMLLDVIIKKGYGSVCVGNDMEAIASGGVFFISQKKAKTAEFSVEIDESGTAKIPQGIVLIEKVDKIHGLSKLNLIDYDKITGRLSVRNRRPSDEIKLTGRPTKSIKKLFNEAHIPPNIRSNLIVIEDDAGIVFVETFGVADRVAADDNTKDKRTVIIKRRNVE